MKYVLSAVSFCLLLCAPLQPVDDRAAMAGLQQRITQLEATLERAEAIRSVKRLQRAYGHYAEYGLWNDLADLFAEKGIGYYLPGNITREDIRKHYIRDVGKGRLGLPEGMVYPHIILQPVITLDPDGRTAKGRWRVFSMLGVYGETAIWAGGIYENVYVLENGAWKIKDLYYYSQYSGRYDQPGWTVDQEFIPMHYDPKRAGTPVPAASSPAASKEPPRSLQSLSLQSRELIARAQMLNDQSDIENLQHIYGFYIDRKMWDDVADLFAPDGTMEIAQEGVYVGRTSIRRSLDQFGSIGLKDGELNDHLQLQTIVDVSPEGLTAKARGAELIMSGKHGVGGDWGEGIFENTYIKQNGIWRIRSMHVYERLAADYDKGWARDARPATGLNKKFPSDRPPSKVYSTYPKFFIPPFHFDNPVTSRPPQYPEHSTGAKLKKKPRTAIVNRAPEAHTISELQKNVDELERLLKRAIAYDASENIVDAYGYYIDSFMWDETADLFARDGWKELSYVGTYVGRERIRQSLKIRYPGGQPAGYFTAHQITQPVIHVAEDGQSAKVRARLFQLGGVSGGNGVWLGGIYENKTALEDGTWKIAAMDLDYVFTANSKGGWAHSAGAIEPPKPPMSSSFPPDRPLRGVVVAPFPKVVDLPFHYVNPASGRRPPLFLP
jgi:hypothetical protein